MMVFWMLLGGATGITAAQRLWHLFDLSAGDVAVAVPIGGVVGPAGGALLGLVTGPRLLAQYVKVGVHELDKEKLAPLLRLRYNNAIADAIADLGKPEEICKVFAGFRQYLYIIAA